MTKSWKVPLGCVVNFAALAVLVLSVYVVATPLEFVVTNAPNAPPPDTLAGSLIALADAFGGDVL
ncbi:Uncharacterised protein [Staphylococcus warneri]|nr:Uncharacterised protein [Staphylococcus warneri]